MSKQEPEAWVLIAFPANPMYFGPFATRDEAVDYFKRNFGDLHKNFDVRLLTRGGK